MKPGVHIASAFIVGLAIGLVGLVIVRHRADKTIAHLEAQRCLVASQDASACLKSLVDLQAGNPAQAGLTLNAHLRDQQTTLKTCLEAPGLPAPVKDLGNLTLSQVRAYRQFDTNAAISPAGLRTKR